VVLTLIKCCQLHQQWDKFITCSAQDGIALAGLEAFHVMLQHYNVVPFLQEVLMSLINNSVLFNTDNDDDFNVFNGSCHLRQITEVVAPYFISPLCRILHNAAILLPDNLSAVLHHNGIDNLLIRFVITCIIGLTDLSGFLSRFMDDKLFLLVLQDSAHSRYTI